MLATTFVYIKKGLSFPEIEEHDFRSCEEIKLRGFIN
jgi:hypothetical protein